MAQTSFTLIAGLLLLINYEVPDAVEDFNTKSVLFLTFVLTTVPILLSYLTRRLISLHLTLIFEILSLGGYVCILFLLNFPVLVNKYLSFLEFVHHSRELISLIPLFIALLGIRLTMHDMRHIDRKHRWELINFYSRSLLLPLIVVFIWNLVIDSSHYLPEGTAGLFLLVMLVPLLALPHIMAPLMMQFLWKTVPLTDEGLKQRLEKLTDRSGIKYRDVAVWQTGGFSIANAAVAGIIPSNRRIYVTDALLRNFTDEQIETIVAHEIGHIRHRHLLISCFLVLIYLLSFVFFFQIVGKPLKSFLNGYPFLLSMVSILFFICYYKIFFNYLSRRFEHQADLYAVHLTNQLEVYKSALVSLGYYSSLPKLIRLVLELFNTHPSLERRIKFLDKSTMENTLNQRYSKCLLEVKVLIALIPIFGIFIFLINW